MRDGSDPFFATILPGMVLILALCSFVPFLGGLFFGVYGGWWVATAIVFVLASYALIAMVRKLETPPAGQDQVRTTQRQLPHWSLIVYSATTGLGWNWACAFLWFSRRYAFFSIPVIGMTGLILTFYAVIAFLIAWLSPRNWRMALFVFLFIPGVVAGIVLRLGLLR